MDNQLGTTPVLENWKNLEVMGLLMRQHVEPIQKCPKFATFCQTV